MNAKGILFDFNGTLLFDTNLHIKSFGQILLQFGAKPISEEQLVKTILGKTNRRLYAELISPQFTEEELQAFVQTKENEYFRLCLALGENFRLADGVCEMLDFLKDNHIPYCLATGSERMNVEFYMEHLNLDRWFDWEHIVYENGSFPGKPAPDIYRIAAERLGLSPAECLVFEDGTAGIRSANAAGAGAVIAIYEAGLPSPLTEDTHVEDVLYDHSQWKNTLAKYGLLR
ncbi:MAG: HAD family phosphatase [Ruminococcaceae bacterium]|nr:HAD family phosphatase [Oscillospiraceae bacterium]